MPGRVWLKPLLAAVVFSTLSWLAGVASCEEASEARPCIEVSPAVFDFGEVNEGDKPRVTFTIKNSGTAELIIYEAKPSCGCTLAKLSSSRLAPGESATIIAVYNSWNSSGQINKFIEVRSNDARRPLLYLDITGTVKANPGIPGVPGA